MSEPTPLLRQYLEVKAAHLEAIVFFHVGDFYEMFFEDAVKAAPILDIALTSRDRHRGEPVPLCGVPYHSASGYIARLIERGHTVAICDQVEDAASATGLVRREVVRVVTPGTVVESELLDPSRPNHLVALASRNDAVGLAAVDISTGAFRAVTFSAQDRDGLRDELARLDPREILVPEGVPPPSGLWKVCARPPGGFEPAAARRRLLEQFAVASLAAYGCDDRPEAISAAGGLLAYLSETQRAVLPHLTGIRFDSPSGFLLLDEPCRRHLELTERQRSVEPKASSSGEGAGSRHGSLLGAIDRTRTAAGGRLLREWLTRPLIDSRAIAARQDAVAELIENGPVRAETRRLLGRIGDIERAVGRLGTRVVAPRDFAVLRASAAVLPELRKTFSGMASEPLQKHLAAWDDLEDLRGLLDRAIAEEVPALLSAGGVIRDGYDPELDEARTLGRDARSVMARIEVRERSRTGIETLKVRHNQVFGFYIEVSRARAGKVPEDYIRKQTLLNAERFITAEIKELEVKVLGAEEQARKRERELVEAVRAQVVAQAARIQRVAAAVAEIDVLAGLAELAVERDYVRPIVEEGSDIEIEEGRHPTLERALPGGRFVPNDLRLDPERRLLIITGPNMAGKSTYLRQAAQIAILAQIGSFVPARSARIGIVDRIFTRIGASDDLTAGQSTFLVEMTETAHLLRHATPRSLVLLDEIGRGTSTFDGISLAWAVAERLHAVGARTLFATHYHELTGLAERLTGIVNLKALVREWNDQIVFLHKIVAGAADKSYGIQVARLAGLPDDVVARARAILARLEAKRALAGDADRQPDLFAVPADDPIDDDGARRLEAYQPVIDRLLAVDPERLTPLEALNLLADLRREISLDTKSE